MSRDDATRKALQWLDEQIELLGGLRNANPRDPSFKSWRQNTLTIFQRIWPGDHTRVDRFRRVPFSPPSAKADARSIREWYGRGCGEAMTLLKEAVDELTANGAPDPALASVAADADDAGPVDDFPTLDLADGEAPATEIEAPASDVLDLGGEGGPAPEAATPAEPEGAPPTLRVDASSAERTPSKTMSRDDLRGHHDAPARGQGPPRIGTPAAKPAPAPEPEPVAQADDGEAQPPNLINVRTKGKAGKPGKRGGMRARLKDMLGLGDLGSRENPPAPAPPARAAEPPAQPARAAQPPAPARAANPPARAAQPTAAPARAATPPSTPAPPPRAADPAPPARRPGPPPLPAEEPKPEGAVFSARGGPRKRGRRTVSIESLISPQFRQAPDAPEPAAPAARDDAPPPPAPAREPARSAAPPQQRAREDAPAARAREAAPPPAPSAAPPSLRQAPEFETPHSQQIPWPPSPEELEKLEHEPPPAPMRAGAPPVFEMPGEDEPDAPPDESLTQPALPEPEPAGAAAPDEAADLEEPDEPAGVQEPDEAALDAEAFARAAEDFISSSPVLGAQGRPVQRQSDGTTYSEPDAVAVGSLAADLARLDVPAGRRGVARAQLLDLAGRLDDGQLDWAALRDAVHFAMEYPELARRLVPILLPWLDRAA